MVDRSHRANFERFVCLWSVMSFRSVGARCLWSDVGCLRPDLAERTVKDSAGQERPIELGPKLRVSFFRCRFLSDELVLLQSVHARARLLGPSCTPSPRRVGDQSRNRLLGCRQELIQGCDERINGHLCMTSSRLGIEFVPDVLAHVRIQPHRASLVVAHDASHLWPWCIVQRRGGPSAARRR